jgi:hypothetical protein
LLVAAEQSVPVSTAIECCYKQIEENVAANKIPACDSFLTLAWLLVTTGLLRLDVWMNIA